MACLRLADFEASSLSRRRGVGNSRNRPAGGLLFGHRPVDVEEANADTSQVGHEGFWRLSDGSRSLTPPASTSREPMGLGPSLILQPKTR